MKQRLYGVMRLGSHFDIFVPDLVSANRKVQIHPVSVHITIFPPWCDSFRRGPRYVKVNKALMFLCAVDLTCPGILDRQATGSLPPGGLQQ